MNHDRAVAVLLSELLPAAADKRPRVGSKSRESDQRERKRDYCFHGESSGISRRPSACGELGYSELTTAQGHCHFYMQSFQCW